MQFLGKVKGYTLVIALVIIMIIAIAAVLCLSYFRINRESLNNATVQAKAMQYCYMALQTCSKQEIYDDELRHELDDGFTLLTCKKRWGVFDLLYATVIRKNSDTQIVKVALAGQSGNNDEFVSLCLRNTNSMVSLGDTVTIAGLCYFPMGTYSTFMKNDRTMIEKSQIRPSPDTLPISPDWIPQDLWHNTLHTTHSGAIDISDTVSISFKSPTMYIDADTVNISGNLHGNIIIKAKRIVVVANAVVDGVIMMASSVSFPDNFHGRLQALVNDSICIGMHCSFLYPSILALLPSVKDRPQNTLGYYYLKAKDSLSIQGEIIAISPFVNYRPRISVILNGRAQIVGAIYTHGTLSWAGQCKGTVIADKIAGVEKRTLKMNYLKNITIDSLNDNFSYSRLFPYIGPKKIASWLK